MRLFVSYARVDKPLCKQIVERLNDVHDVWYDRRLFAGQEWWAEIQRRLQWCDGFVYLLSPESIKSEYCQKEFNLAVKQGKHIFPVLIQARTPIPDSISHIHIADLSEGMENMYEVLNAVTIAERIANAHKISPTTIAADDTSELPAPTKRTTVAAAIGNAADALEHQDFDQAVFLLQQIEAEGRSGRIVQTMLEEAEQVLERQTHLREAAREYAPIVELVKREGTRALGCNEFADFQHDFPDYDPENLASFCKEINTSVTPPAIDSPRSAQRTGEGAGVRAHATAEAIRAIIGDLFDWCEVPAGEFLYGDDKQKRTLPAFAIAKYPITYSQFQVFIDAKDGFHHDRWWDGLAADAKHRKQPGDQKWKIAEHPRENVSWYDAIAFCRWLSFKMGGGYAIDKVADWHIRLPTEFEWEKAARGTKGLVYPYGNEFDKTKCNTEESGIGQTTLVTQYPQGASPYGVVDMSGNVWEWCLTDYNNSENVDIGTNVRRVVRGGSWALNQGSARAVYRGGSGPYNRYGNFGFRLVRPPSH